MRKAPFLSVIIPVYKVEKYLRQCIDSVLRQQVDGMEILLVDDGSPDTCPQICDEYAEKYPFVSVIHKENRGLSSARNAGIRAAKGTFLVFIDSDDWWNPKVNVPILLKEVRKRPETEMFLFSSYDFFEGDGYYQRVEHLYLNQISTDTAEHYYRDLLENGNLEVSAYTKFLNRAFLLKNRLFFREGLLGEDNEWMLRLLRCLRRVEVMNVPLYIYRGRRAGSISNTISEKSVRDLLRIIQSSRKYYQQHVDDPLERYELDYCAYLWFSALGLSSKLSRRERGRLRSYFYKTSDVCRCSRSPKMKTAMHVYKTFGIEMTTLILGSYIKLKNRLPIHKKKVPDVEVSG